MILRWELEYTFLYRHNNLMSNYDQLHRQCRTLESLFDSKLSSYSQVVHTLSRPGFDVEASGSAERWKDLEAELDDLAAKVCLVVLILRVLNQNFALVGRNQ